MAGLDPATYAVPVCEASPLESGFAALLAPLGPWPVNRRVAVAVSGGADSVCLAWIAKTWGDPVALIVDHGLRPGSDNEARVTAARLAALDIEWKILTLRDLAAGAGLAARARLARYAALASACAEVGLSDLLLGHHAADQAETVLIRRGAGSGPAGLAAMPVIAETSGLRVVRPLLTILPDRLKALLRAKDIGWVEDPSNADVKTLRARIRQRLACDGGGDIATLCRSANQDAQRRHKAEQRIAETLAARASLFPQGYALLTPGPIDPDCLGALIRCLTGAPYAPATGSLMRLAANPKPGTLGGIRFLKAGRLGDGLLLVREEAAIQPPILAMGADNWDRRFSVSGAENLPHGATIGALGHEASRLRRHFNLPAAILRTLPALRHDGQILAVPHAGFFSGWTNPSLRLTFSPPSPAAGAAFYAG